ncbi:MAG: superoxide dismutase family protein [Clostridia bacterium]|nr:superoxide dismutase family protein [Clostridia bacterium]
MNKGNRYPNFAVLSRHRPQAQATVIGAPGYPDLQGSVRFYQTAYGTVVLAEITGLPIPRGRCESPVFGFHIHEGSRCTGDAADYFADVRNHYNPYECKHPYHAGDLPPLFGANGVAFSMFLSDRFTVEEIVGKTVIIHHHPDDFVTQPSGNAGAKIACGEIVLY